MLPISRALYRKLAPLLSVEALSADRERRHQALLAAIEMTLKRMADDPDFSRPGRRLYLDIRLHFPVIELPRVRRIIDRHMPLAVARAERLRREHLYGLEHCQALRRSGDPCSRPAIEGRRYCPSHKHLQEPVPGLDEPLRERLASAT